MLSPSRHLTLAQTFLVTAPSFFLYGYNQAGFSALLTLPDVVRLFPQIDTVNTQGEQASSNSTIQGLVNATLQLGALVGALSCSLIGDKLGRRRSIFLASVIATIGQILQCTSFSLPQLIVGRVILGLGVGQLNVTVPVWETESSAAEKRGRKVITAGIFICVGFLSSAWINFGCSKISYPPLQWRIPLAIPTLCSILVCFTIFTLPESPRWLVQDHQITNAKEALARLNGVSSNDRHVEYEISRIEHALESAPTASMMDIFSNDAKSSRLGYRFILCIVIQSMQQLCGGNLISIYTKKIFESNLHLSGDIPTIIAACALTWKFLSSFIAYAAVDRLGRRQIFLISGGGMCMCMILLSAMTSLPSSNKAASIVSGVMIFVFNTFYPIGFLGGNFLYCAEVAPARLRVAMSSISIANHWLWNFIFTMITPVAMETIGWKFWLVFVCTCACIPLVIVPFYPETKNRNLELIDRVFNEAPTIWDIVPMARRIPEGSLGVDESIFTDKKEEGEAEDEEQREFV